ncbi:MAG: carbon-nitrogen hydrolase family protein, partial [Deinococcales bacterium]
MSESSRSPFVVAAVQAAPRFLDLEASLEKACELIHEAGSQGARLAVFPECFLPTYPLWSWFVPPFASRELRPLYAELLDNAVTVPGPVTDRLGQAARDAGVNVVMGVNEVNQEASRASLFNTVLVFDASGHLRSRHRKLVPTVAERLIHAAGDGSTLDVVELDEARLGSLICWENYMPLARYALYAWGAEILAMPTWDRGEPWLSTLRHVAKEGRVTVVSACIPFHRDLIPEGYDFTRHLPDVAWLNPGDSAIVDPDGKMLAGPLHEEEGILYAELDPASWRGSRYQLDVAGHYGRPDIFDLQVDRRPR